MPYATAADMIDRYGEQEMTGLTDRAGAGVPDTVAIDRALADAADQIDGHLRGRYALPLAAVPLVIARMTCDIARYLLWSDRASDEVRQRYEDAVKTLAYIGDGRIRLGLPAPSASPPGTGGTLEVATGARPRDWGMLS